MSKLTEKDLTQELLKEMFDYHEDGYLVWKERPITHFDTESNWKRFNTPNRGVRAGYFNKRTDSNREGFGYYRVGITLKGLGFTIGHFKLHRLIFAYHHGYFPELVDHKDNYTTNNKIDNLRSATLQQNGFNSAPNYNKKYKGVSYFKSRGVYRASLHVREDTYFLGNYKNEDEAAQSYNIACKRLYEDYSLLNNTPFPEDKVTLKGKFWEQILPKLLREKEIKIV